MNKKIKLTEGQKVIISVPFTYEIGEESYQQSGTILETIEDCEKEVRLELLNGVVSYDAFLEVIEPSEKISNILFRYADEHGLLSTKDDIENFNEWLKNNNITNEF